MSDQSPPLPYCVMVTPAHGDPIYLGFTTMAEAALVREGLQRCRWPAWARGTALAHGGTPEGVTVTRPVPLDVTELANVLTLERAFTRRGGPSWPTVADRLIAQEGQATAGPRLEQAEELVDQMEVTRLIGARVSLERVRVVLSRYVNPGTVDNVMEALRRED